MKNIHFNVLISTLVVIILTGCAGIGPGTVDRDRFDYVSALSNSWKKQMLLNLVKIRYVDAPVFMEVSSIISQYSVEGEINLSATWSNSDSQTVGGSGKYTDRPTITYNPLTGEKFSRSLVTPIPIRGFLFLIQTGFPVDFMFRIGVQTINGVDNRFGGKMMGRSADLNFNSLIEAMRRIQRSHGIGLRVKPIGGKEAMFMFFRRKYQDEIAAEINTVRQILGLNPDSEEFPVLYGAIAADDREIAILTRSILQIMIEMASYIEVPENDIKEGRVDSFLDESSANDHPLIRIRSDASRPEESFVAVNYKDNWFWIDDTDLDSKRTFSFLMLLFSLTETGGKGGAPIVTVPTN